MKQRTECCKQCPFSRATSKEYLDTMGQNGMKFLGQSYAGMYLPCHMEPGFQNCAVDPEVPQCAGAAKFRANLKIKVNEAVIGKLPPDKETVFDNAEDFLMHHVGCSRQAVKFLLSFISPQELAWFETQRGRVMLVEKQRGDESLG